MPLIKLSLKVKTNFIIDSLPFLDDPWLTFAGVNALGVDTPDFLFGVVELDKYFDPSGYSHRKDRSPRVKISWCRRATGWCRGTFLEFSKVAMEDIDSTKTYIKNKHIAIISTLFHTRDQWFVFPSELISFRVFTIKTI